MRGGPARVAIAAVAGIVVALVGPGLGATASDGASAVGGPPSLEVSPRRVDPGDPVTFVVRNCATEPEISFFEYDFMEQVAPVETDPGTWTAQHRAGSVDVHVSARCDAVELGPIVVDVDNPLMSFIPIGPDLPPPDPPTHVYGTDCPDGTTVTLDVVADVEVGGDVPVSSPAVAPEPRSSTEVPIDERGDWDAPLPGFDDRPGATVTVRARCGDVVYPPLSFRAPGEPPSNPVAERPPTAEPAAAPEASPPAVPVSGTPTFTG